MANFFCYMILGTISALLGWVFLVDHSWSVTAAPQESVLNFYNWFGSLQDWQRFYEGPAVDLMLKYCEIEDDSNIFEYGYGTGYLAKELLKKHSKSAYIGVDISKTMYDLSTDRLKEYSDRVELHLAQDSLGVLNALPNNSIDRFVSTYVFDLLPKATMQKIIKTLQYKLKPNGKICLTSLTSKGSDVSYIAKIFINGWNTISRFCKMCMGGCRPIDLRYPFTVQHLKTLTVAHDEIYIQYGLPSQILIAEKYDTERQKLY